MTCLSCIGTGASDVVVERGTAGASAAREFHRRHEKRKSKIRKQWGPLGGLAVALTDDPHSIKAWAYGAKGERELGGELDRLLDEGMGVLHDRRLPGHRTNIDHIAIVPSGVFVIDAKNYVGRVERIDRGGWFATDHRLYVRGRDKTALVTAMAKQAEVVRAALGSDLTAIPVKQVICFTDADWSLLARPLIFGDVTVVWPRELGKMLRVEGPLRPDQISQIERKIALELRPA